MKMGMESKTSAIPKKEKRNGYGEQKTSAIPNKAKANGYIERKVRYIPKRKDFSINEMAQKILLKGEEANS